MAPDRDDLLERRGLAAHRLFARHRDRDHNGRHCGVIHGDDVEHD